MIKNIKDYIPKVGDWIEFERYGKVYIHQVVQLINVYECVAVERNIKNGQLVDILLYEGEEKDLVLSIRRPKHFLGHMYKFLSDDNYSDIIYKFKPLTKSDLNVGDWVKYDQDTEWYQVVYKKDDYLVFVDQFSQEWADSKNLDEEWDIVEVRRPNHEEGYGYTFLYKNIEECEVVFLKK